MSWLPEDLEKYVEAHSEPESELLVRIRRETHLEVLKPRMLSGHVQGRVLAMLSQLIRPNRILEIGTYTGYATLCLAEGLTERGQMITLDSNAELMKRTQRYFDESPYSKQIQLRIGTALEILPELTGPFDLVFIDADKENYLNYFNFVIDKVSEGGILIADNVLWSGHVTNPNRQDKDTTAIRAFNEAVHTDPRVQNVLFPIRDGLQVLRKL